MPSQSLSPPPSAQAAATLEDRLRGAVWGQFVGDAVCLGSHWIYNLTELKKNFPDGIRGFEAPAEGHYHAGKLPGDQTHYGEAALLLLETVAERGRFDPVAFGRRFAGVMGSPDYRGYTDSATRGTLEALRIFQQENPGMPFAFQDGADDDQLATASRLAPVVVAHLDDDRLLAVVAAATRVCQSNARAVAYMRCHALLLRELFAGRDLHSAFHRVEEQLAGGEGFDGEILRKIRAAFQAKHLNVTEATLHFGQSCPLICSFPAAVQAAARYADQYPTAILEIARAGGDSAGRASLAGAWLGACLGVAGIPEAWRSRLRHRERIQAALDRLLTRERLAAFEADLAGPSLALSSRPAAPPEKAIAATEGGVARGVLELAAAVLSGQEGVVGLKPLERVDCMAGAPFDFLGFLDGRPCLFAVKAGRKRFLPPDERLKRRLLALADRLGGVRVALLQLKLDPGRYRLIADDDLRRLPDGFESRMAKMACWVREHFHPGASPR